MTIEEAKKQLWELIRDREDRERILDTENLKVSDSIKEIYRKDIEALKKAVEVLEKQIPKKPIEKSPWVYHCPRCDSRTIEDAFIKKFKFCPDCGQALDWSDTDD